jgi:hypothetical protein
MPETLQLPQEDHDLLLRIAERIETFVEHQHIQDRRISRLSRRTSTLEQLRDEGRGAARAMRLMWVLLAGIAGLIGYKFRGAH